MLYNIIYSVPLRTGTCYIRDILELVLQLQGYCVLQESQMQMNFTLAVAHPSRHLWPHPHTLFGDMASLVNPLGRDKCQNVRT